MRSRSPLAGILGFVLAACATTPQTGVREILDERTGVTVTSMQVPLEFYSPRPERGLQAASFAYLAPLEVNRMGKRDTYLWLSVLRGDDDDSDESAPAASGPPGLRITLEGEALEPAFVSANARELGMGLPVYERPADWVGEAYYAVTPQEIARLAAASALVLQLSAAGEEARTYELSEMGLEGLRTFSERIGSENP